MTYAKRLSTLLAFLFTSLTPAFSATENACSRLERFADGTTDASTALRNCLSQIPAGGHLDLPRGIYRLQRPLSVARPVVIETAGSRQTSPPCSENMAACATLLLDPRAPFERGKMLLEVTANEVTFDRLVIRGIESSRRLRSACKMPDQRPTGGGIRVTGAVRFTLRRSVLRDFTCYTALEITSGARDLSIERNLVGPNGDHRPGEIWSDGVTIHDAVRAKVSDNRFIDNTDVQLIFGGCVDCRIERNDFRHSGSARRGAFAELMLQSWPNTSGDFSRTRVTGNRIDCGPHRRCGYGIMIGAAPWYPGRATGGIVAENRVANAVIGLNIDGLTGPMTVQGNEVSGSGGMAPSDCGTRTWPAVNIAPTSRRFVIGDPTPLDEGSVSTTGCLVGRKVHLKM